jgi:phosphoglycerate dehydrogenase-like enzyme
MERPTLLLAGRMTQPRVGWMEQTLTSDWTILSWSEDEPFEALTEKASRADAVVAGRIEGGWPAFPKLKLYQIPFTGHDWIGPGDVPDGCLVCNTFEHEIAVAEYVLAAMLEKEIGLAASDRHFRAQGWDGKSSWSGASHGELFGKTVGIIGYGRIGREVARRARAFGMRCIAVTRTAAPAPAPRERVEDMEGLDNMLRESDYVLIALPLSEETKDLIGQHRLALMKAEAVIINVGRGLVIEEAALYAALAEQRIGGAIIDVWYQYPRDGDLVRRPSTFPFHELDNIIMTPHFSAHSEAMRARRWAFVAANIDRMARGEELENVCFLGRGQRSAELS